MFPQFVYVVTPKILNRYSHSEDGIRKFEQHLAMFPHPVYIFYYGTFPKSKEFNLTSIAVRVQCNFDLKASSFHMLNDVTELAQLVSAHTKVFSKAKAVANHPFKAGRLEEKCGLSFLPKTVKKTTNGPGRPPNEQSIKAANPEFWEEAIAIWVKKVWLSQLTQFKGVTDQIANAFALVYPTPKMLFDAVQSSNRQLILSRNFSL
ncbi:crossover junction endonuclease eme1 [Cichlidogyrus casuarinus]|uniref:Crossover junction endonuclease eme1 n=1 Tax=Cichlidogyrus casuarinus TaxID=1844966 RepID=A0ABD2QLE8_9PLAT